MAGQATAAGAGGLVYLRVGDSSSLDAAKPVKEGLSDQAWQGILQRCSAGPVRPRLCTMPGVCTLPGGCTLPGLCALVADGDHVTGLSHVAAGLLDLLHKGDAAVGLEPGRPPFLWWWWWWSTL